MTIEFKNFDAAEYLDSEKSIAAYINAAFVENDPDLLMSALNDVIRAQGIAAVAKQAGVGRESLYKTLSAGSSPRIETVFKLLTALGIKLTVQPATKKRATRAKGGDKNYALAA